MEQAKFEELKKKILAELNQAHLLGINAKTLHEHALAIALNLRFKWLQKGAKKLPKILETLSADVAAHLVTKAEKAEFDAVKQIIKNLVRLYLTLFGLLLYMKHDLEEFIAHIKKLEKKYKGRISKELLDRFMKLMNECISDWKTEIQEFRKELNSVWAKAKGNAGWSLAFFEKMHKDDSYWTRFRERKLFRDALREEKNFEKNFDKLMKAGSKEEFEKYVINMAKESRATVKDFRILNKFLYASWDSANASMDNLIKIVADAAGIHEVPAADSEQMKELHILINEKLNEKYLHSLRIGDKQLEALLSQLENEMKGVERLAA